jgi:catechol 2,3-dioxygenase-like lactoylglutathione lyase family enzyme
MRVLGLDHVVLRVADAARSLRFYGEALGCAEERRDDELGLIQLRAGTSLIDLVPLDSRLGRAGGAPPGSEGHNQDHFCLRVAPFDAEALCDRLRRVGAEPGPVERRYGAEGFGPSLYVRDPDGNMVELKGPAEPDEPTTGKRS